MRPLCLLILLASACDDKPAAPTTRTLVILHTNDEHSHLLGDGPQLGDLPELEDYPAPMSPGTGRIKGGAGRRMVLLQQERDAATAMKADTLTVSAGDNAMSTLFMVPFARTAPDLVVMKALGYDL